MKPVLINILVLLVAVCGQKICKSYECTTTNARPIEQQDYCIYEPYVVLNRYTAFVYSGACSVSKYCKEQSVPQDDTRKELVRAVCTPRPYYFAAEESFAGDRCDSFEALYACSHGTKCYNYRCSVKRKGDGCTNSKQCGPNLYCEQANSCDYYKPKGACCEKSEECGRKARCMYAEKPSSCEFGVCTEYFSQPAGTILNIRSEYDVFLCEDGFAEDEDYETYTEERASNKQNFRSSGKMICGVKFFSLKKGKECRSYTSCYVGKTTTTTVRLDNRYADCGCFYDDTGYPRCGLMNGDSEFDEYRAAFKDHMEKSQHCHVMHDFEYECGDPVAYRKFMCARLKVKYYAASQVSSCLIDISNADLYPEIAAFHKWCSEED